MKTYLKNVVLCLWILGAVLVAWGLLELGQAVVRAQLGISDAGMDLAALAVVTIGGAVKTYRDWRKKRREAGIISVLLADTIQKQREKLESIDAEEPSAGRARRRAMCSITLIALEEKRDRMIKGKKEWRKNGH